LNIYRRYSFQSKGEKSEKDINRKEPEKGLVFLFLFVCFLVASASSHELIVRNGFLYVDYQYQKATPSEGTT